MLKYPYLGFDPEDFHSLYNPYRTDSELRRFLAFAICVAGKQAKSTAKALNSLLADQDNLYKYSPFDNPRCPFLWVGYYPTNSARYLWSKGFGCYNQRAKAFVELNYKLQKGKIDLRTCTITDLENCYGIGFKTSRFFLLYTREDQKVAALDTHVWKYVRKVLPNAPDKIPSSRKNYDLWSGRFLDHMSIKYPNFSYAMMDFFIWDKIRKGTLDDDT